jgi:rod shape-determining protein MreC
MIEKDNDLNFTKVLILNVGSVLLVLLSITGIFTPLYSLTDTLTRGIRANLISIANNFEDVASTLGNLAGIKKERDSLQAKIAVLESENSQLKEKELQAKALEAQLKTTFDRQYEQVAVKIIKIDLKEEGVIVIDRGTEEGVKEGDILVTQNYALGEIKKANLHTSDVLLINSSKSQVPVISQTHQVKGILVGQFGGEIMVNNILQTDPLDIDESFVTLGTNSNYPAGLLVGKVSEVGSVQTETKKTVRLASPININNLTTAFVLKIQK